MAAVNFPNSPSTNDTHTSSGSTWKWDGTVWQRLGVAGPQGAQGHQGVQGATGNTGATGAQGHQGVQGATGAQGHQGVQGATGSASLSNNADNRVITGGSGTNLNGEANLTFNGSTLTVNGDTLFTGNSYNATWDKSEDSLIFGNNTKAAFGSSQNFRIYHDGTTNFLKGVGGDAIEVWTNNTKRFTVQSNGNSLYVDDAKIFFGTGSDFRFWHDGSTNNIWGTGAHELKIATNNTERLRITSTGAIQNYYNSNLPVTDSRPILQLGYGVIGDDNSGYNAVTCNAYPVSGDSSWHYIGSSSLGASRYHIGFGDHKWFTAAAGTRGNDITWSERLRITSAGLIGINNGSPATVLDIKSTKASDGLTVTKGSNVAAFLGHNGTGDEGLLHLKDGGTTTIQIYGETGQTSFFNAGNVGIGINNPNRLLTLYGDSGIALQNSTTGTGNSNGTHIWVNSTGNGELLIQNRESSDIKFYTSDQEKVRIDSSGRVIINRAGNDFVLNSNDAAMHINTPTDGGQGGLYVRCRGQGGGTASPHYGVKIDALNCANNANLQAGILIDLNQQYTQSGTGIQSDVYGSYNATKCFDGILRKQLGAFTNGYTYFSNIIPTSSGGSAYHFVGQNNGSDRIRIDLGGNITNTNNSYGQISDQKLKENIVDANSQWDDIKAVKVRNFNFTAASGLETHKQIGVVAQELETVSAGLVHTDNDITLDEATGEGTVTGTTKSVKYSVLYMKSIKALQEAMARIETLEAEVAALKS